MQAGLLASPKDLTSPAIREINQPRMIHFDQSGPPIVEPGIVRCHGCIVGGGLPQFVGRTYAPWNDRVGIDNATVTGLDCPGMRSGKNGKAAIAVSGLRPCPNW